MDYFNIGEFTIWILDSVCYLDHGLNNQSIDDEHKSMIWILGWSIFQILTVFESFGKAGSWLDIYCLGEY